MNFGFPVDLERVVVDTLKIMLREAFFFFFGYWFSRPQAVRVRVRVR